MNRVKRNWLAVGVTGLVIAGLGIVTVPKRAQATVDADVRAGVYTDANAFAVGAGVLAGMGHSNWYFNPNVEVARGDRDQVSMNGDFHYDIARQSKTAFWVGAGPALLVKDRTGGSNTDVGVNVLTGVGAKRGEVRPFAQLRGTMADQNEVAIAGGIRF